uniref:Uncharacterized protein n=1 Tax=Arundo donax TaxID=35708 RepID=A0A0A8ZMN2_ARUDO
MNPAIRHKLYSIKTLTYKNKPTLRP